MSEPERDRWGRYVLTDPTTGKERPWTRATTLAGTLEDSFGLTNWKMRSVVIGLSLREDLMDLAYASDPEDKKQLDGLCESAMEAAKTSARSNQGTSLHKFTERIDAGEPSGAPKRWQADLDAYVAFKEANGIQTHPSMIERITVVPELSVAGTIDRIAKHEGEPKITDLKTGASLKFGGMKIAMQLAIYSRGAGLWNEDTGQWEPMVKVSQTEGIIIHLPASIPAKPGEPAPMPKPALYRVDLNKGYEMAKVAFMVREWRKDKTMLMADNGANMYESQEWDQA